MITPAWNVNWTRYDDCSIQIFAENVRLYRVEDAVCSWQLRDDDTLHHSDLCNKTDEFALNGYGIFDTDNRISHRCYIE